MVKDLQPGALVEATRLLDPDAAKVASGSRGVVFREANYFRDGAGPIVRWFTGAVCNIYEGDVRVISE